MHIICGYVGNRAIEEVCSRDATGINEIKQLLKRAPVAFQEDYQFIQEAVAVAEKITLNTKDHFELSIWSHVYFLY